MFGCWWLILVLFAVVDGNVGVDAGSVDAGVG
jgi:hypothetical protein